MQCILQPARQGTAGPTALAAHRARRLPAHGPTGADLSDFGGEEPGAVGEALRAHFCSLRRRLVGCTLEDFQVGWGGWVQGWVQGAGAGVWVWAWAVCYSDGRVV